MLRANDERQPAVPVPGFVQILKMYEVPDAGFM
jgi:hypothetical protein